ncbi:hypothetical protein B0O80DRAFT_427139 [Mortierella sp. GBAus27b]|nr:hypothetical protein BGX31_008072 [Mortierella sp. GBA43]KAI8353119.1 hypothetical protein B0O80DRAFT_427139 [Mortierella sp. GBAus27b]
MNNPNDPNNANNANNADNPLRYAVEFPPCLHRGDLEVSFRFNHGNGDPQRANLTTWKQASRQNPGSHRADAGLVDEINAGTIGIGTVYLEVYRSCGQTSRSLHSQNDGSGDHGTQGQENVRDQGDSVQPEDQAEGPSSATISQDTAAAEVVFSKPSDLSLQNGLGEDELPDQEEVPPGPVQGAVHPNSGQEEESEESLNDKRKQANRNGKRRVNTAVGDGEQEEDGRTEKKIKVAQQGTSSGVSTVNSKWANGRFPDPPPSRTTKVVQIPCRCHLDHPNLPQND